jgi:hypothetical protein
MTPRYRPQPLWRPDAPLIVGSIMGNLITLPLTMLAQVPLWQLAFVYSMVPWLGMLLWNAFCLLCSFQNSRLDRESPEVHP